MLAIGIIFLAASFIRKDFFRVSYSIIAIDPSPPCLTSAISTLRRASVTRPLQPVRAACVQRARSKQKHARACPLFMIFCCPYCMHGFWHIRLRARACV